MVGKYPRENPRGKLWGRGELSEGNCSEGSCMVTVTEFVVLFTDMFSF